MRFDPRSLRKEEPKLGCPMVSYKDPITRSRSKFVNLVTHLDGKESFPTFQSLEGIGVISEAKLGRFKIAARWLGRGSALALIRGLNKLEFPFKPLFLVEQLGYMFPYL